MLRVKNLNFSYQSKEELTIKNISFESKEGEITAILGPNGAGKSTLFNLILGILKPSGGSVEVDEVCLNSLKFNSRARYISYVPQEWNSPFNYKAIEIVLMGLASKIGMLSNPSGADIKRAEELFEFLDIKKLARKGIKDISGGERQMVLLCRALIQDTPVLLLDEPTSHLDLKNQMKILSTLEYLISTKKISIVLTLHDPNLASQYANNIVALKRGEIYASGSVEDMVKKEILEGLYEHPIEIAILEGRHMIRGKKMKL
ncbi:ABC transporter ATP-binding protein [Campylobacter sp.]|uniref:ABC transporter ATP-binding protein n=1 Tax=Campylobacter sp. TaxID=205 RepID=UPI0026FF055A|nr:ABC transporter ATP-binding protein [Campylobacter sp.]